MALDRDLADHIARLRLGRVGEVLAAADAWIVGGVARAVAGRTKPDADIDIAVDGDVEPLLAELGLPSKRHDRFGTAVVALEDGRHADIARTRTETYAQPGALPDVAPAPIEDDLARRDFTVNAIAIAIAPPHRVLDPFGGAQDLDAGVLRVLHPNSFADDPTRAIRAARYCSRLGLVPEPETRRLLSGIDLGLVSADRRDAELRRLAAERSAAAGFGLLAEWGVLALPDGDTALLEAVGRIRIEPPWSGHPDPGVRAMLIAAGRATGLGAARDLASAHPQLPSTAVAAARGVDEAMLLVALAAGGAWIDRYVREWRDVRLEIDGGDLLAAGIDAGPAVGAGLEGALARKLDGELEGGREAELAAALEIARQST